jgi:UDP-N-acetylglucosamine:LPS N-acetylglucosamine transferase
MILIPHPHTGNNHQYYNAKIFEKKWHDCILQENIGTELRWVLEKYTTYKKSVDLPPLDTHIYEQIIQKIMQ